MSFGKVFVYSKGPASVAARLYDFGVGKSELKPEHQKWLVSNVVDLLDAGGSVVLIGLTSRTDTPEINQGLSNRRTDSVVRFLRSKTRNNFRAAIEVGMGERAAQYAGVKDNVESKNWRAVVLHAWDFPSPPGPPLPPPPKPIATVERRVAVAFLASFKINDRGATAWDDAGPRVADATMAIQHENKLRRGGYPVEQEKKEQISTEANKLVWITVKRSTSSYEIILGGVDMRYCHVTYGWSRRYASGGPILLSHWHRVGVNSNAPPLAYRLAEAQAQLWLKDPPKALVTELFDGRRTGQPVNVDKVIQEYMDSMESWGNFFP